VFAGQGVWHVVRTQRNMRVHLAAGLAAIIVGLILRIGAADWACVLTVIGLVLTAETLNTVVEALVDLCTDEFHPLAKAAKDMAAGAGADLVRRGGGRGHRGVPAPAAQGVGLIVGPGSRRAGPDRVVMVAAAPSVTSALLGFDHRPRPFRTA
jgi:diacylglycerol kinase